MGLRVAMATSTTTTMPALIGRILWMMVGPITLLLLALHIAQQRDGWFTLPSLAYFFVLLGTFLGRWMEFRCGFPMTAMGEPATTDHLRRYALASGTLGVAIWLIANLVGDHLIYR
jgi:hypothetical protein